MNKPLKDHRQIGWDQELFFTHEEAPGAPFWLPKGMIIFKELEKYIRQLTEEAGYKEISTPIMVKTKLFKTSGHWDSFGADAMYNLAVYEEDEVLEIHRKVLEQKDEFIKKLKGNGGQPISEKIAIEIDNRNEIIDVTLFLVSGELGINPEVNYTLKPMNCPEATIIYSYMPRSYKELPLRLSEIGRLHRREQSGELNGILRVRQLTMDDAHVFVSEDQILLEIMAILDTLTSFYKSFNFEFEFKLATRPEKYIGEIKDWDKAEKDLELALKERKLKYSIKEKDGAFYGPKIDLHIKDSLGRSWQLGTVQIDFALPSKKHFNLTYIDNEGTEKQVIMIHRAIFGSFERFLGILLEHHQGSLPLWLSPVQVQIVPISDKHLIHAMNLMKDFKESGIRAELDNKSGTMQSKIREATLQRVPYIVIIGDKEIEASSVAVRTREGKDLGGKTLSEFTQLLRDQIDKKI